MTGKKYQKRDKARAEAADTASKKTAPSTQGGYTIIPTPRSARAKQKRRVTASKQSTVAMKSTGKDSSTPPSVEISTLVTETEREIDRQLAELTDVPENTEKQGLRGPLDLLFGVFGKQVRTVTS